MVCGISDLNLNFGNMNDELPSGFNSYKGFFLYGCDGSDEKLPDFPQVREEFNIKNTLKYTKPCMGKFSSIQDVLDGFILDGILGDYKQEELPLMHQNLPNNENMIISEKSIFIFDRIL